MSAASIEKRIPLNGLPAIQAKIATETRGRQIRTPSTLFEGFHFVIKNPKRR